MSKQPKKKLIENPGHKNLSVVGRPKGSLNKSTVRYQEALSNANFSVAEETMKMFLDPNTPSDIKLKLLQLMTEFSTHKPKPLPEEPPTIIVEANKPIQPTPEELSALLKLAATIEEPK